MENLQKNVTTAIGRIARAKHDKGTAADRNPEKETMYFGGSIWVGGEICSKCKFFYFYILFSDIYKCVYW